MTENHLRRPSGFECCVLLLFAIQSSLAFPGPATLSAQEIAADGPSAASSERGATQVTSPPRQNGQAQGNVQRRVRELIYILRHHRVSKRQDEWGGAIRELVEIGPAAVPELVRELESTDRNATMRGLLFTLRAIGDPRALPFVIQAIPQAEAQARRGSDMGIYFATPGLHSFLKQHENWPSPDEWVAYGRPTNEILGTLHRLAGQRLPDLSVRGPHPTWKTAYWREWWDHGRSDLKLSFEAAIELPSRDEDLVERDGTRQFGPLFPTGPDQYLSNAVEITLSSFRLAGAASCLDFETGKLYEYLEGVRYGPEKAHDRLDSRRWLVSKGIDLTVGNGRDLHVWLIDDDRWDTLDSEVRSDEPLPLGREALDLTPFDKHPRDFKSDWMGTFLFITREGSRGVLRRYPYDKATASQRFQYRLWNRRAIEPHRSTPPPRPAPGEWTAARIVVLKEPGPGKQCLFDFDKGQSSMLPASVVAATASKDLSELLKRGSILGNAAIAAWARENEIDLATHITGVVGMGDAPNLLRNGHMVQLTMLDAREIKISPELFDSLSVLHAKELLVRSPDAFRVAYLLPPLQSGTPPAAFLFETKDGSIGLVKILNTGSELTSISFEYKLANEHQEEQP